MNDNRLIKKIRDRIKREAFIKALLWGCAIGFAVATFVAFGLWFADLTVAGKVIIALASFALSAFISTIILNHCFKPSEKAVMRRIDAVGLDERMITMLEYRQDDSYIAKAQREDAKNKLQGVSAKDIAVRVPYAGVIVTACTCVAMSCMIGVAARVNVRNVIPLTIEYVQQESVTQAYKKPVYGSYTYLEDGGYFIGNPEQVIVFGTETEMVHARGDIGNGFSQWDDTTMEEMMEQTVSPDRSDIFDEMNSFHDSTAAATPMALAFDEAQEAPATPNLNTFIYTASFAKSDGNGNGPGDSESEGDPSDNPSDGDNGEGEGEDNSDSNSSGESAPDREPNGQPSNGASGGSQDMSNMVIDGETDYRDVIDQYIAEAKEKLESGEELPAELRELLEAYYQALQ